jgi:hypothetical protein
MKHLKEFRDWSWWRKKPSSRLRVECENEEVKSLVVENLLGVLNGLGVNASVVQTGEFGDPYYLSVTPAIPLEEILEGLPEGEGGLDVRLSYESSAGSVLLGWDWERGFWKKNLV